MDHSRAPLLDALADYHLKDRYGFSPPGHRTGLEAGMPLPDIADPQLERVRVVA